jgi:hypothetical protein
MWSCREDALLALYKKLMEMPVGTQKEDLKNMLRASVFLIRRAIKDIVASVSPSTCCPQVTDITVTQLPVRPGMRVPSKRLGK